MRKKMLTLAAVTVFAFALAACATPQTGSDSTPTAEPTVEVEATTAPTVEPEATSTPVPTSTPEPTATSTPEPTATSTPVPTATSTPVPTATPEPTPVPTEPVVDDGNNVSVPDYITELLALETGDERREYYREYIRYEIDDCERIRTDSWNEEGTNEGYFSVYYMDLYDELGFAYFGVYALQSTTGAYPTVPYMVELAIDEYGEIFYWYLTYEEFVEQYGTPDEILARVDAFLNQPDCQCGKDTCPCKCLRDDIECPGTYCDGPREGV